MNRITQTLLTLAAVFVILFGLLFFANAGWDMIESLFGPRRVSDVVNVDPQDQSLVETLRLSNITLVGDGPLLRATLVSEQSYDQGSYGKSSDSNVVNFGFLAPGEPARWMFAAGKQLIVTHEVLSLRGDMMAPVAGEDIFATSTSAADPARDRDQEHEVAMMLALVEADSNGDKRLSTQDAMTLALTRPDGNGRVDLATGLMSIPYSLPSRSDLTFLIETAAGHEVLRVNPATFDVTDRQPVAFPKP